MADVKQVHRTVSDREPRIVMEEELLAVAFTDTDSAQRIFEKYLGIAADGTVAFDNKYFNIIVPLRVVGNSGNDAILRDERGVVDITRFPAVVLLSSTEPGTISKCKNAWENLCNEVCENAVRILFLNGDDLDEIETYEHVAWGLSMGIEVVNSLMCKEDDIEISVRLKRILECAPWPSISQEKSAQKLSLQESHQKSTGDGEAREDSLNDVNLLNPTSLRRGLHENDVTKLVNDLILADDSDNDDPT